MRESVRGWLTRHWLSRPPIGVRLARYDKRSASIAGPFIARGSCLEPWIHDGDVLWVDTSLAPNDRDLVGAEMWCLLDHSRVRRFPDEPKPAAEHRPVIKQYRRTPAGEFLVCHDGWFRLCGEHRLSGVVVGLARRNCRHKLADLDIPDRVRRLVA